MKKVVKLLHLVNRYCIVGVIILELIARGGCHEKVAFKRDAVAASSAQADTADSNYEEYPVNDCSTFNRSNPCNRKCRRESILPPPGRPWFMIITFCLSHQYCMKREKRCCVKKKKN